MIKLALMRHGVTAWNRAGRIQGRTDIPLDADAGAELSCYRLPVELRKYEIVSSPLKRAMQTAEIISGLSPLSEAALLEMDWGDWEGKRARDVAAEENTAFRHLEDWGWNYRPPGGESPADVRSRVEPWAMGLQRDTVAVCHIGVMRTLLAVAHGWNFEGTPPFSVKRNRLYLLNITDRLRIGDPSCVRLGKNLR